MKYRSAQIAVTDGEYGAGGRSRTDTPSEGRGILSPVRLPVPPLRHTRTANSVEASVRQLQSSNCKRLA